MIENDNDRWEYNGDGVSLVFAYDNVIFAAANVDVYVDGALKTLTVDFAVSGAPEYLAGNITFIVAPPAGVKNVVIQRNVTNRQQTAFPVGTSFPSKAVEKAFDRACVEIQQLATKVKRSLQLGPAITGAVSLVLASLEAGKFIRVNGAGDGIELATIQISDSVVSAGEGIEGIASVATQATVNAEANDTRFVTPKKLGVWFTAKLAGPIAAAIAAAVAAAVATVTAARPYFSVHKNGVDQTGLLPATETKITFATEIEDVGGYFATSRWTPPAGIVELKASVAFTAGLVDQEVYFVGIYKNGSVFKYGQQSRESGAASLAVSINVYDRANGGDFYEVYAAGTGAGNKTVAGTAVNTWFQGHWKGA
jgi:hypothetical protein